MEDRFEDNYKMTRAVVRASVLFRGMRSVDNGFDLKRGLGADGPEREAAIMLDRLREVIRSNALATKMSEGGVIMAGSAEPGRSDRHNIYLRCPAVKMLRHLYAVKLRGAQVIWIYAPRNPTVSGCTRSSTGSGETR